MAVTSGCNSYARIEIKEGVTVGILDHGAKATLCNQRIASRIGRRDILVILFDYPPGIGTWKGSDKAREFCVR
jgi:hypothetical protein